MSDLPHLATDEAGNEAVPSLDSAPSSGTKPGRCLRCQGRMFPASDGDRVCFSCGNVVYALPPLIDADMHKRKATHAGWSLS